jgi:hypothetical protein
VSDKPILFSAPMVRALIAGRKSQTRRIIKRQSALDAIATFGPEFLLVPGNADLVRFAKGDRLWVRETWAPLDRLTHNDPGTTALAERGFYKADNSTIEGSISRWTPAIHMPRWASRLTLTVTDVRVQRLQDISEEDAIAEGSQEPSLVPIVGGCWSERQVYANLWNHINGAGSWDANPWVVAVSFTTERRNIDATGGRDG